MNNTLESNTAMMEQVYFSLTFLDTVVMVSSLTFTFSMRQTSPIKAMKMKPIFTKKTHDELKPTKKNLFEDWFEI